jgi:hypothetical protein
MQNELAVLDEEILGSTTTAMLQEYEYEKSNFSLIRNMPERYKITHVNAEALAKVIRNFLRNESTEYGTLKESVDLELLNLFRHLEERHIDIDENEHIDKRNRILIATAFHSGSTFTGNLFNANPDVFYMFEPLQFVQFHDTWSRPRIRQNESNYHLSNMLECEFGKSMRASKYYYPDSESRRAGWFGKCFKGKSSTYKCTKTRLK